MIETQSRGISRKTAFLMAGAAWMVAPACVQAQAVSSSATTSTDPARDPGSASESTGDANTIGDIVVTAQKRSQSLSEVPLSITAASGDTLATRGIIDPSQLPKIVPGLSFNLTASGQPIYTPRGVGFQESSLSASPTVSVYVDEVPIPYSAATLGASLDLERVEVLKGPQGTLFGQNATGGAINYIAAKPTSDLSAGLRAEYGRFNAVDLAGYISAPLTNTLKVRVAGRLVRSDAWQKSGTRDDQLGSADRLMGRVLVEWQPASDLTATLNVNGWRDHSQTQAGQFLIPLSQTTSAALFPAVRDFPGYALTPRSADWDPGKNYNKNNRFWQTSLRVDYKLSDVVKLTSITSYQRFRQRQPVDADGTPYEAIYFTQTGDVKSFFQELRVSGEFSDRGNWIVGGNYGHDTVVEASQIDFSQSSSRAAATSAINGDTQKIKTEAVYGNAEYRIFGPISVLDGVRYTEADRDYSGCTILNSFPSVFGVPKGSCITRLVAGGYGITSQTLKENNVSWRAGINFKPSRDFLLYGTVSKGYKSGSFPLISILFEPQAIPVKQENLLAYEAGVKTALLDRAVRLNAAIFYYDYRDKQTIGNVERPPFGRLSTLINIPKSHVFGIEADAVIKPVAGLTISPSVEYLKSEVDQSFVNVVSDGSISDFKGQPFPYTPKVSGNTDVEYRWGIQSGLDAFVGGTATYQTHSNGGFGNIPAFDVRGYTLLDLRAGVEASNGRWKASVFGRNVTNTYYWITATRFTDTVIRFTGMPATYGVSVGYQF